MPPARPAHVPAELADVIGAIPELAGAGEVSVLPGGLTNDNYTVAAGGRVCVLRRWSLDSGLLAIDRDNEYENSLRAAEVGIGPAVVAYRPELRTIVFEFVPGETLSAERLRGEDHVGAIAAACRRLHGARPFRADFDMFEVQRGYLEIVARRGLRLPDGYETFAGHVDAIRDALAPGAERRVPCHNDLLAENLIVSPNGLRVIDFEYSGNNEPSFELGNVWSESDLSTAQLERLVAAYWGRPLRHKVARARLWGVMSKYGWMLWASIQDGVSELDFDFWSWGMEKYERAVAEFEGERFGWLLDEARRPD